MEGFIGLAFTCFVLWAVWHIVTYPFKEHGKCRGTGRVGSSRAFHKCEQCGGTGRQLRLIYRVFGRDRKW